MIYFIMGVSGCGKTTIGKQLAQQLGIPFFDGDDFHPPANIRKMASGKALDDNDRQDWLEAIAQKAQQQARLQGAIFACSALKAHYRRILDQGLSSPPNWIFLKGDFDLIQQRMQERKKHFMPPHLLQSQFDILEHPEEAFEIDISRPTEEIIETILILTAQSKDNMKNQAAFGLIGLGVMGKSLSLNMIDKGVNMALYNRHVEGVEEKVAASFVADHQLEGKAQGFDQLSEFVAALERPRKILMMVKAGDAVDQLIAELRPYLSKDDILIDGGNSHYKDTDRRTSELAAQGLHFFGSGISGGEEGARKGPSIMPGGSADAYPYIGDFLESIAARDKQGAACCTFIGPGGAGHFVKMVHNGIEYAEMQLLAEVYQLCRLGRQQSPLQIAALLDQWAEQGANSYLLEITADILRKKEDEAWLIDQILDRAGNKGTGSWTTIAASELGVPTTLISAALFARYTSSFKAERVAAASLLQIAPKDQASLSDEALFNAYQLARWVNHHQGFQLIATASKEYNWSLNLSEIARIWTNGCIIRSGLMEKLIGLLKENAALLTQAEPLALIKERRQDLLEVAAFGPAKAIPLPCLSAALTYLDTFFQEHSSANVIQAQRDYFGAHTYQRVDDDSGKHYHTRWKELPS